MRVARLFVGTLTLSSIGLGLYILFAGVTLQLENQTGQQIKNIRVHFGGGSFTVATLGENEVLKKRLGKIGEGATFIVDWQEISGVNRHARLGVYFFGLTGYHTVLIRFLPDGKSELVYQDRTYFPEEHLTNHSSRQGPRGLGG